MPRRAAPQAKAPPAPAGSAPAEQARAPVNTGNASEERVQMSRLRQTIARRLKEAQNTAAILTTFNDVDMTAVIDARARYKDLFEKKHGIRLGFMGFFVKACALAAKDVPAVNARIDGDEHRLPRLSRRLDRGVGAQGPGRAGGPQRRQA